MKTFEVKLDKSKWMWSIESSYAQVINPKTDSRITISKIRMDRFPVAHNLLIKKIFSLHHNEEPIMITYKEGLLLVDIGKWSNMGTGCFWDIANGAQGKQLGFKQIN